MGWVRAEARLGQRTLVTLLVDERARRARVRACALLASSGFIDVTGHEELLMAFKQWLVGGVLALGFVAGGVKSAQASEWVVLRTNVDARSFAGDWLVSTSQVT